MKEEYPVLLYYKYVPISNPERFAAEHRALCSDLGLKGRVLVAAEGLNGTVCGRREAIEGYQRALWEDERFADLEFKVSEGRADTFPKLIVRVRPEIVTLKAGIPLEPDLDNQLTPVDWKRAIEEDPEVVLIDVRNKYESAAGRFRNAIACDIENFRDLPGYVEKLGHLKKKRVLMYCTGGIRCEKASALFRKKGFERVEQLRGGIVTYQKEFGNEHWLGECFVFDNRMTVRVEPGMELVGKCAHSGRITTRFVNCLHDPCHSLFLLHEDTERENPECRLCPDCLRGGLRLGTAFYKGSSSFEELRQHSCAGSKGLSETGD